MSDITLPPGFDISNYFLDAEGVTSGKDYLGITSPPLGGGSSLGGMPSAGMPSAGGATNNFGQTQAQQPPAPLVYMGPGTQQEVPAGTADDTPRGLGSGGSTTVTTGKAHTAKVNDLLEKFAKASPREQRRMALLLSLAGYAGSGDLKSSIEYGVSMTLGDTVEAYANLLTDAANAFRYKETPTSLLRKNIAYRFPAGTWDGDLDTVDEALGKLGYQIPDVGSMDSAVVEDEAKKKKDKPFVGTKTTTSTSVVRDIMDPADAKALTRAMLQRELGRDPTEEEFADFIGAIQYAQKTHPSKSTTVQKNRFEKDKYAPGGSRMVEQTSNTTSRSGITSEGIADIALQKARQNPNWAEWQAVGTYAPALFEALGATVQGR